MVQTAMMGKLPYTALRDAVFTHPTMAEGLGALFGGVPAHTQAGADTGFLSEIGAAARHFAPEQRQAAARRQSPRSS